MNKEKRNSKLLMWFSKCELYRPNIKEIIKGTGIPKSTIYDFYNNLLKQNRVMIHIEILTEKEAQKRISIKELIKDCIEENEED